MPRQGGATLTANHEINVAINVPYFREVDGAHTRILAETGFRVEYADHSLESSEVRELVGRIDPHYVVAYEEGWTEEAITAANRLRGIIKFGKGTDSIDLESASRHGVAVTNTRYCNVMPTVEMARGLLHCALREIPLRNEEVSRGEWNQPLVGELARSTVLIVGFGDLGMWLAKDLFESGVRVIVCSRSLGERQSAMIDYLRTLPGGWRRMERYFPAGDHTGYGTIDWISRDQLDARRHEADSIIFMLPLTKDTEGIADRTFLQGCKPGVIVGNVGRGRLIADESAVAELLDSGQLRWFFADVLRDEPATVGSTPLLEHPRATLMPHIGAATKQNLVRCGSTAVNIMTALHEGRPLPEGRIWLVPPG